MKLLCILVSKELLFSIYFCFLTLLFCFPFKADIFCLPEVCLLCTLEGLVLE